MFSELQESYLHKHHKDEPHLTVIPLFEALNIGEKHRDVDEQSQLASHIPWDPYRLHIMKQEKPIYNGVVSQSLHFA